MKKILTGLQPTGVITIGNYLGSIKQMVDMQNEYESIIFLPDMHAVTVELDPEYLHSNIRQLAALYLACGIDPNKNTIFLQSENIYHTNISWLLECNTMFGELSRMTQFKDKSSKNASFSVGLFTYPVLMAADILIYDVDYVPVGIDQKQHVELARDLAQRFNNKYGETFKIPDVKISKNGLKIMDLVDPTKKMSKSSENKKSFITLLDTEEEIKKKIMGATTDSENLIAYDMENKPGVSNLINIASCFSGESIDSIVEKYQGKGYGDLKKYVAQIVIESIKKIQDKYEEIKNDNIIDEMLESGAKKTSEIAKVKYDLMKNKMGLYK
ncbi:MAG: tryptophan--tRNA ligase [bacterium]